MSAPAAITKKPPGRKRRFAGWAMLALGLLTAAVWTASRWFYSSFALGDWSAEIECGALEVWHGDPPVISSPTWLGDQPEGDREWWFLTRGGRPPTADAMLDLRFLVYMHETDVNQQRSSTLVVMMWPFPLLLGVTGGLTLRSSIVGRHRAKVGKCPACGYSLAGLAAGAACPECGAGTPLTSTRRRTE